MNCVHFVITGDWHCAYVLLYGPRVYTKDGEEDMKPKTTDSTETKKESSMEH